MLVGREGRKCGFLGDSPTPCGENGRFHIPFRIAVIEEIAVFAVLDEVGVTLDARGDNGLTETESLEDIEWQTLDRKSVV